MSDGSTFEMSGGTISGNTADDGGGVYMMSSGSTFEMSGGTISGNTADDGGGVYVMSDGSTFTMSDDAVISENTASNNGGGVYVKSGKFTMSGGEISNNTAEWYGGGVYEDNSGTFGMSGDAVISGNTADYGGGVYVFGGQFTMSGDAVISGNTADYGGGVSVYSSGTFEMSGNAAISGNTAVSGGGVSVYSSGTFEMSGDAVISGNTAPKGGGVYLSSGMFEMSGGEISVNTASNNGGGVYVSGGEFTMSGDAVISGNTASNNGGGVCMFGSSTFKLSGSGSTDSVYLASGKSITVTGALTGTENQVSGIELAILDAGTRVVTFESTVSDPANYVSSFTLDSSMGQRVLKYENNALILADAWKVTFDTTGGTPGTYDVLVAKDTPVTKPAAPTMTGYTFTGWYEEEECTNQWDFDTPVTQDMTLYAGWNQDEPGPGPEPVPDPTPVPPSGGSSGDGNMENAFRVLFNDGATTLTVQTDLSYGDTITKPADPVKDGYTFAGWYKDSACTQPWDFETGIPGDMTLYAKWTTVIEATPTATATATAVTTPQPTATQTAAATTSVPQATTAAAVSPTPCRRSPSEKTPPVKEPLFRGRETSPSFLSQHQAPA